EARGLGARFERRVREAGLLFEMRQEVARRGQVIPDLGKEQRALLAVADGEAVDRGPQLLEQVRLAHERDWSEMTQNRDRDRGRRDFLGGHRVEATVLGRRLSGVGPDVGYQPRGRFQRADAAAALAAERAP